LKPAVVSTLSEATLDRLRQAFVWFTFAANGLEGLAAKKLRRDFAANPWPDDPIEGLLDMAELVFELTEELVEKLGRPNKKRGPKPEPREERIPGRSGRPFKYTPAGTPLLVREILADLDQQVRQGLPLAIAEVVRRHVTASCTFASELHLKAEVRRVAQILYYLRSPRRKTPA
jgi:hypothetical protein